MLLTFLLLSLLTHFTNANTEKTIFLGPPPLQIPIEHPTLSDLHLSSLSPQHWSFRTHLRADFHTNSSTKGYSSWYLLHRLEEGQRYEVRICWAATQPTSFDLKTHDLPTVFQTPELITSLAEYSEERRLKYELRDDGASKHKTKTDDLSSALFLQVFAAADYYTTNKTLMANVPPVFVDIILDPFIFNILPRSLLPTVAYITLLAIGSWYLSKYISKWFLSFAREEVDVTKKKS
ncbi:hypothetical protein HYALB_00008800 [Hymenoscyphus albidus]|uniref:Uncharacterized protein n=1 Tax=Hymenoscyphus albidus TaxID=595503 RepID=A0A9N9LWA1_9HELO|nr:hypothetical protein HYALB_00008800 [Hymenoscyphus albidus]